MCELLQLNFSCLNRLWKIHTRRSKLYGILIHGENRWTVYRDQEYNLKQNGQNRVHWEEKHWSKTEEGKLDMSIEREYTRWKWTKI